jgi:hypothetical protein
VLVVTADNTVAQRKVEIGPIEDGALRVIETGLKPDDRVVIAGLLRAIPGQKVDPQLQKIEAPNADNVTADAAKPDNSKPDNSKTDNSKPSSK